MSRYIDDLIKDFERQRQELVKQHGEDDSFVVCMDTVVIPTIIRLANKIELREEDNKEISYNDSRSSTCTTR